MRQMSKTKFWRFCMTRPGAGNIHSFNSKLSQGSLKGLVKIPCEHKCRTEHGLGSRSGHERSPESFFFFGSAAHDLYSLWRVQFKSRRHFAIWLHESQGQGRVGSTPGYIRINFQIDCSEYEICVSEPVWSKDSKNVIFSVRYLEIHKNAFWKNDVINGHGFWAICLPKIDIST